MRPISDGIHEFDVTEDGVNMRAWSFIPRSLIEKTKFKIVKSHNEDLFVAPAGHEEGLFPISCCWWLTTKQLDSIHLFGKQHFKEEVISIKDVMDIQNFANELEMDTYPSMHVMDRIFCLIKKLHIKTKLRNDQLEPTKTNRLQVDPIPIIPHR